MAAHLSDDGHTVNTRVLTATYFMRAKRRGASRGVRGGPRARERVKVMGDVIPSAQWPPENESVMAARRDSSMPRWHLSSNFVDTTRNSVVDIVTRVDLVVSWFRHNGFAPLRECFRRIRKPRSTLLDLIFIT